jgi:hypothetical protein
MEYPIANLISFTNLTEINSKFNTKYGRVDDRHLTTFDKELQAHNMSELEYKFYKKQMESNKSF